MDKETLSNYGWVVIVVIVLAIMIALASPFGNYIADGTKTILKSFSTSANIDVEAEGEEPSTATVSGAIIRVDDVSEVSHNPVVTLSSDTVTDFSSVSVTRAGKNLLSVDDFNQPYLSYYPMKDFSLDTSTGTLKFTKDSEKNTKDCYVVKKLYLSKGTYTLSADTQHNGDGGYATVWGYDGDGKLYGLTSSIVAGQLADGFTFEIPTSAYYAIRFHIPFYSEIDTEITYSNIQLEVGNERTEFEPYNAQIVTANADGSVDGITSVSPTMTIFTDNSDVEVTCEYQKKKITTNIPTLSLLSQTNAFVDTPIKFYFLNLTGLNSLEGVNVQVDSGNRGTVYSDRWEYTPTSAESFTLKISMTDAEGAEIYKGETVVNVKDSTQKDSLSVLVIGDSTIEANHETKALLDYATNDNYNLTLFGTKGTAPNLHEGRGGWTAALYLTKDTSPFYNSSTSSFDFEYYMNNNGYSSIDCVVLQLGVNDVFNAQTDYSLNNSFAPNYINNMKKIIEGIHSYDSNIKIIWNMILPGSTDQSKFEEAYGTSQTADRYKRNAYLTNIQIIEECSSLENVYICPAGMSLDTANNMAAGGSGGVHPAQAGYVEIGTTLYGVIRAIN